MEQVGIRAVPSKRSSLRVGRGEVLRPIAGCPVDEAWGFSPGGQQCGKHMGRRFGGQSAQMMRVWHVHHPGKGIFCRDQGESAHKLSCPGYRLCGLACWLPGRVECRSDNGAWGGV